MPQKLKFEQIKNESGTSLRYGWTAQDYRDEIPLHFHPEIEICHILKGSGYRMTGDFIEPFSSGEVMWMPANLPHCWIYKPESCEPDHNRECIFVQFDASLLQTGLSFFNEWKYAANRLLAIRQSISLTGDTAEKVKSALKEMGALSGSDRLLKLLQVLQWIGTTSDIRLVGMQDNVHNTITKDMERIQLVFKYVIEHYKNKVTVPEVAASIHMTPVAFCSFFKRETGKTFISFLNEYRIEVACTLLRSFPDRDVNEIAWQCGFADVPHFNRSFRRMKGMAPREWRVLTPAITNL